MELFLFLLAILIAAGVLTSIFMWPPPQSKKSKNNYRESIAAKQKKQKLKLFSCETDNLEKLEARKDFIKKRITDYSLLRKDTDINELVLFMAQIELQKIEAELDQRKSSFFHYVD